MPSVYICHHGIKRQRWGFRRFQNPDGSLTPAGRERYRKLKAKADKIEAKKQKMFPKEVPEKKETPNPHGKKRIHDMTDDELSSEISRLKLEQTYKSLMKDLYPPKQKKEALINGRKLVGDILTNSLKNVGTSVATNVAGDYANKLGKHLGLEYPLYKPEQKKQEEKKDDNPIANIVSQVTKSGKTKNKNKNKEGSK